MRLNCTLSTPSIGDLKKHLEGSYAFYVSRVMRKPAICTCENKAADQLCGNCTADQCHCFYYINSTIPLLPKPLAICGCTAWFVSDPF